VQHKPTVYTCNEPFHVFLSLGRGGGWEEGHNKYKWMVLADSVNLLHEMKGGKPRACYIGPPPPFPSLTFCMDTFNNVQHLENITKSTAKLHSPHQCHAQQATMPRTTSHYAMHNEPLCRAQRATMPCTTSY